MNTRSHVVLVVLGTVCGLQGNAGEPSPGAPEAQASIPFVDNGGIRSWRVDGRDTLLIESIGGQWYRATLLGPCFDLPFAETVGVQPTPGGTFDRFGAVYVRGQKCPLTSLVKAPPPTNPTKGAPTTAAQVPK